MLTCDQIEVNEVREDEDVIFVEYTGRDNEITFTYSIDEFTKLTNEIKNLAACPKVINTIFKPKWCIGFVDKPNGQVVMIELGGKKASCRFNVTLGNLKTIGKNLRHEQINWK